MLSRQVFTKNLYFVALNKGNSDTNFLLVITVFLAKKIKKRDFLDKNTFFKERITGDCVSKDTDGID